MASTGESAALSGLARSLVADNVLEHEIAVEAVQSAMKNRTPFVTHLVQNDLAKARDVAISAAKEFGIPLFDLDAFDSESVPKDIVSENLIRKHHALPLAKRGTRLFLAESSST